MNREIIISLFEKKDRKRRRILYSLYQEYFDQGLSSVFIANLVNDDLQSPELVSPEDIKYCRFYFKGKVKVPKRLPSARASPSESCEKSVASNSPIQWSDPDQLDAIQNQIVKSKFSKAWIVSLNLPFNPRAG